MSATGVIFLGLSTSLIDELIIYYNRIKALSDEFFHIATDIDNGNKWKVIHLYPLNTDLAGNSYGLMTACLVSKLKGRGFT